MVYKFFESKVSGSGAKLIPEIKQLANELHKPIRKFEKRKVCSIFKGNIWGIDLADMQLLSKCHKGIRFLLCVINIFSKYAWVVPLKDKKGISVDKAFQITLKQSNKKPNKIWVDKGSEFIMHILKNGCETMILLCIQHIMKENLLLLKDLLEREKVKFIST